jgi:hypothetical protein
MYGSFDDKFNAALANKLKNQDINAQSGQTTAGANLMSAQTQANQVGDLNFLRRSQGTADLMNAGTQRADLASMNPMGLNSNQVNSFGLRGLFSPTGVANANSNAIYGTGAQAGTMAQATQRFGSVYDKYLQDLPAGQAPQAPNMYEPTRPRSVPGQARGGVIGDVEDDTGQDTRTVRARPGEYFINPETITHGFGGGNYEHGVRNLDEIVRRSTGREPGPTYPKGKAGYARSGALVPQYDPSTTADEFRNFVVRNAVGMDPAAQQDWLRRSENVQFAPRRGEVAPVAQHGRSYIDRPDYTDGRDALLARQAAAPAPVNARDQLLARQAAAPQPGDLSANQWNAHIDRLQTGKGGYPMLAAGGAVPEQGGALRNYLKAMRFIGGGVAPVATAGMVHPTIGTVKTLLTPESGGGPSTLGRMARFYSTGFGATGDNYPMPAGSDAPAAEWEQRMNAALGGAPPDAVENSRAAAAQARAATAAEVGPGSKGFTGPPVAPLDYSADVGVTSNHPRTFVPPPVIREADGAWDIRNAIQKGGTSGQQARLDYGRAYTSAPIVATADKTGRYNQFGGGPGLRNGGRVPGFADSGVFYPPAVIPGQGPIDLSDPQAQADNVGRIAQARADAEARAQATARAQAAAQAESDRMDLAQGLRERTDAAQAAADAEARRTGARWRTLFTDPVGSAKAGGAKAVEAAKAVLPSAETLALAGKGLSKASKLATPVAAGMDLAAIGNVMTDPTKTKGDALEEAARKAAQWGAAATGAAGGAALGSFAGPIGGAVGGIGGGLAGYFGVGEGLRGLFGDAPSQTAHGKFDAILGNGGGAAQAQPTPAAAVAQDQPAQDQPAQAVAAPSGPQPPNLRDYMMLRALALGGMGKGAAKEQESLLGYLGTTDATSGRNALAMRQAQMEHEKEIEATLLPRFTSTVTDKDGKTKDVTDHAGYTRFVADMATRHVPIFDVSRTTRDQLLAEWQARDRAQQRIRQIQSSVGDPRAYTSERIQPIGLKSGLGLGDYLGSPNISLGDYAMSFTGRGLRNQVAQVPFYDPVSRTTRTAAYPAQKVFGNTDNTTDLDALRYAVGK